MQYLTLELNKTLFFLIYSIKYRHKEERTNDY